MGLSQDLTLDVGVWLCVAEMPHYAFQQTRLPHLLSSSSSPQPLLSIVGRTVAVLGSSRPFSSSPPTRASMTSVRPAQNRSSAGQQAAAAKPAAALADGTRPPGAVHLHRTW